MHFALSVSIWEIRADLTRRESFVKPITKQTTPEQATALAETNRRPLVRAEVIATHLDCHKRSVLLWAEKGIIPCVRIGGSVRFDLEAVLGASK